MNKQTVTQIRIPKDLDDQVNRVCEEYGMSKNSAMLMLMKLGFKILNADVKITLHPEECLKQ